MKSVVAKITEKYTVIVCPICQQKEKIPDNFTSYTWACPCCNYEIKSVLQDLPDPKKIIDCIYHGLRWHTKRIAELTKKITALKRDQVKFSKLKFRPVSETGKFHQEYVKKQFTEKIKEAESKLKQAEKFKEILEDLLPFNLEIKMKSR